MSGSRISILELRSVRGTGGGPEKTILLGAERRNRDRFDVTVCYVRDVRDDVFAIDDRARRLDIDYVEVRERHSFDVRIWRTLQRLVSDRAIDVVHSHDYKTDLLAYFLARGRRVIPLSTAHGWTGKSRRERFVYYPCGKRLLASFPCVIAVSTDIKRELVAHGADANRVVVILNGVDSTQIRRNDERRELVRQRLGYASSDIVIGAVGRLEREKRFDVLLEAFAMTAHAQPRLRLLIVGDGSLRAELAARAAALELGDRCQFAGHRDDVIDLHHSFDLMVQSSEYEGTPNVVLEAMAMGTPIVATDVGGTCELVTPETHAKIVPPGDVLSLRQAIGAALDDPQASQQRAAAARIRVETELSFEARTQRLEAVYERLLQDRGHPLASRPVADLTHA